MAVLQVTIGMVVIFAGFFFLLSEDDLKTIREVFHRTRTFDERTIHRRRQVSYVLYLTGLCIAVLGVLGLTEAPAYTPDRGRAISIAQRLVQEHHSDQYMKQIMQEVTSGAVIQ